MVLRNRRSWQSLADLQQGSNDSLSVGDIDLSADLMERIVVNSKALRLAAVRFGGFLGVECAGYRGETDQYELTVADDNAQIGVATGVSRVTRAESSKYSISDDDLNRHNFRNGTLGLLLNTAAQEDRLSITERLDPSAQAQLLDRALRESAIKGILRHNTIDIWKSRQRTHNGMITTVDAMISGIAGGAILAGGPPLQVAGAVGLFVSAYNLFNARTTSKLLNADVKDALIDPFSASMRWSRALMGCGILATQQLVEAQ